MISYIGQLIRSGRLELTHYTANGVKQRKQTATKTELCCYLDPRKVLKGLVPNFTDHTAIF